MIDIIPYLPSYQYLEPKKDQKTRNCLIVDVKETCRKNLHWKGGQGDVWKPILALFLVDLNLDGKVYVFDPEPDFILQLTCHLSPHVEDWAGKYIMFSLIETDFDSLSGRRNEAKFIFAGERAELQFVSGSQQQGGREQCQLDA